MEQDFALGEDEAGYKIPEEALEIIRPILIDQNNSSADKTRVIVLYTLHVGGKGTTLLVFSVFTVLPLS